MARRFVAFGSFLAVVVSLAFLLLACQPSPASLTTSTAPLATQVPTTVPEETGTPTANSYSWRGTTLTLAVALPKEPGEAGVYLGHPDTPTSIEDARALADQFGMQGHVYSSGTGFLVVDGNRRLSAQSDYQFIYYPSHFNYSISDSANQSPENAEALISEFMQEYGFDMNYRVSYSEPYNAYFALPLSPDGVPLRFPHFAASGFQFSFDKEGIVSVYATLLKYEPIGTFGIISADEAFQKLLAPDPKYGTLEGFISPSGSPQAWVREYPFDETITIYGRMNSIPSAEGAEPLISLDSYVVTGNISGIAEDMPDTFVEATGQFHTENGTDFFVLDSWQPHAPQEGWLGTLERQGDDVKLVTTDHGILLMPDVPADVPLPLENVYAMGVTVGNTFEWNAFDLRFVNGGGGGGGGGLGFYGLNLSGTPMPLPTLASPQQLQPQVGEGLEGLRGFVSVTLFNQPDGSQRAEYYLFYVLEGQPFSTAIMLQGEGLEELQANHNRPIDVWGTVTGFNEQSGMAVVDVDRFAVPFPDLQFQILRGTQQTLQVDGQPGILFTTTEGQSYLQLMPGGGVDGMLIGNEGDEVLLEGLIVPDETFAGYATVHDFSASMAVDPKNGQARNLQITADQPNIMDAPQPQVQKTVEVPTAVIDNVELVYLIPYPSYALPDSDFYIQPMWHFTGHYSRGDVFEVFVQALRPEFLSPEIVTVEPPG
ncbi:MAG: hypothetical protein M1347_00865 [Chloroflexi bacterium]|nr:hypothetical protein [Chloroflexota bacterium]